MDEQIRRHDPRYPSAPNPQEFRFDRNRGLYIPRAVAEEDPRGADKPGRKKKPRSGLTAWLTLAVLAGQLIIFWQQLAIQRAQTRAQIVLGTSDGKIMELAERGDKRVVLVYLRNVGHVPARDVSVELQPIILNPDAGVDLSMEKPAFFGPTIGPGFADIRYVNIPADKIPLIGTALLEVVGRVRYRDAYGAYCE